MIAGQAATGVGIGPNSIDYVLGIVKAYTTRVGEGPFPTELLDAEGKPDADGDRLGTRGHEFGTTTGRQRRCGWFDACLVRQTCATSGINGISLTKLDVLDGFETLKICTGYDLDGERLDYLPTAADQQARCKPIYEELEGWSESTEGARSWAELLDECDQIRAPRRGADPMPRRASVHQPGAGRHHSGDRSLRRLMAREGLSYRARRIWALVILLVGMPLYIVLTVTIVEPSGSPAALARTSGLCRAGRGLGAALQVRVQGRGQGRPGCAARRTPKVTDITVGTKGWRRSLRAKPEAIHLLSDTLRCAD